MKYSKLKTSPYSGWLSLCCISLLLSGVIALPILDDLAESHQLGRAVRVDPEN